MKWQMSNHGALRRIMGNRLLLHIIYWISYVCFFGVIWGTYDMDFKKTFSVEIISLPAKIVLVYFVLYVLMPRFLFKRKFVVFFLLLSLSLFVASLVQRLLDNYIILDTYFQHWEKQQVFNHITMITTVLKMSVVLAIPGTIKTMNFLRSIEQKQQELEKEKLKAELAALKNQVHPHFLFNTLNSLYSLIIKKSDQALEVILRFSDLLRYLLYETNEPKVEINRELGFVKSYLELEKIRYGKNLTVIWNEEGDIPGKSIAPMLILPFVENSVKHSNGSATQMAEINICTAIHGYTFHLNIENNMPAKSNLPKTGGIGLQNVIKRLNILYPENYELDIKELPTKFSVHLKINLLGYES